MHSRSFSRLAIAFALCLAAGAFSSVIISIVGVSRHSSTLPKPVESVSSRRFIDFSTRGPNLSVNRLVISKTAGLEQTGVIRQKPMSLSQNRFVTATTKVDAAAGFRAKAASAHIFPLSAAKRRALLAQQFKQLMSSEERSILIRSLRVLASLLEKTGVTYFLYGGTLLGSFRHRGLIPWDDDLDIIANYSQEATLRRALEHVPGYKLDLWSTWRYKFYAEDALPILGKAWLWPFIDIFFFNETDSRIFASTSIPNGIYSYAKSDVFPLIKRPFEDLWLPVPHSEELIVKQDYDLTLCVSNMYSHKNEEHVPESKRYSVACKQLYAIYPFVFRNLSQFSVHEIVKVGDKVIAEYTYS